MVIYLVYAYEFYKLRCQTRVKVSHEVVHYLWPTLLYFIVHLGSLIGNLHSVLRIILARLPEPPLLAYSRVPLPSGISSQLVKGCGMSGP